MSDEGGALVSHRKPQPDRKKTPTTPTPAPIRADDRWHLQIVSRRRRCRRAPPPGCLAIFVERPLIKETGQDVVIASDRRRIQNRFK
jgi:hypothetical protein